MILCRLGEGIDRYSSIHTVACLLNFFTGCFGQIFIFREAIIGKQAHYYMPYGISEKYCNSKLGYCIFLLYINTQQKLLYSS